jgi:hypothetical protein
MGTRGSSLGIKRPRREADRPLPSNAEVKECVELYLHTQYVFMAIKSIGTSLPLLYYYMELSQNSLKFVVVIIIIYCMELF